MNVTHFANEYNNIIYNKGCMNGYVIVQWTDEGIYAQM